MKKNLFYHFLVAFLVASIWLLFANKECEYNHDFLAINGFNWFTWLAWGLGLFFVYILYLLVVNKIKPKNFIQKFLIFLIIYWPFLILAETVGYYTFNIHNIAAANYPGLPICHCMHAPLWMQIGYFSLGPIYFLICYLLKLENNSKKRLINNLSFLRKSTLQSAFICFYWTKSN